MDELFYLNFHLLTQLTVIHCLYEAFTFCTQNACQDLFAFVAKQAGLCFTWLHTSNSEGGYFNDVHHGLMFYDGVVVHLAVILILSD